MEPAELEELVATAPVSVLVAALAPLDKKQRSRLSKTALAIQKAIWRPGEHDSDRYRRHDLATIAVLAVCPQSALRNAGTLHDPDVAYEVLRHRDKATVEALCNRALDREFALIPWAAVRRLVREGLCARPTSDGYIRHMGTHWSDNRTPQQVLEADPELLDHEVWRLFEVETQHLVWGWDKQKPRADSWTSALLAVCADGRLDRQRLLDATLSGLWISSNGSLLGGFRKLHVGLNPTTPEIRARIDRYADLLSHDVSHVRGLGIDMLASVLRGTILDAAAATQCCEKLSPVLSAKQKGHAIKALRLTETLVNEHGADRERASHRIADGLLHELADVQDHALSLLERWWEGLTEGLRSSFASRREDVAAQLRDRFDALVAGASAADPIEKPAEDGGGDSPETLAPGDLWEQVHGLSASQRERAGLAGIERASLGALDPAPLILRPEDTARLESREAIAPIETVEQLIDCVAHALEQMDDAAEYERILDGVSRLCASTDSACEPRVAPVRKRIVDLRSSQRRGILTGQFGFATLDLLESWADGSVHTTDTSRWNRWALRGVCRFQVERLNELTARVGRRIAAPLLSAPTHTGGFVAPATLVERVEEALRIGELARTDLLLALLRAGSTGRALAARRAAVLPEPWRGLLHYAFGGPDPVPEGQVDSPLWVAAAKARAPLGDTPAADVLPLPDAGPAAHITWSTRPDEHYDVLDVHVAPPYTNRLPARRPGRLARLLGPKRDDPLALPRQAAFYPTALLHEHDRYSDERSAWEFEWLATITPATIDAHAALGAQACWLRMDQNASTMAPVHAYLRPLTDPLRPWTECIVLEVLLATQSRDGDLRATAVDVWCAAIEDGRADVEVLHAVLHRLAPTRLFKPGRFAGAMSEVARISVLHATLVADLIERHLATADELPRGSHATLELLLTLLAELRRPLGDDARGRLADLRGSSKAAKLAKSLLALDGKDSSRRQARLEAVRVRVERALRGP